MVAMESRFFHSNFNTFFHGTQKNPWHGGGPRWFAPASGKGDHILETPITSLSECVVRITKM